MGTRGLADRLRKLSSFQIILYGFLTVILMGTLLLMLPFATWAGQRTPFLDALFTSTSAVCVTGLIINDTATYWSLFGQLVIIVLIQIGGLGVVTVAISIAVASGRKIGLMQRSTMQEAIAAPQVGGIVRMTSFIFKMSFLIELTGAAVMSPVFIRDFGAAKGIWYALFHSVSAFCNAGFDLMGVRTPFSSVTAYCANPVISLTIPALIVVGGIGFLTWNDMSINKFHFSRYRMQSKVILSATAALVILPALFFYFVEFASPAWAELSVGERVLCSIFQAVTPRTAGFNSVELTALSEPAQVLLTVLMLIGGSPGSTAGGMKTTTLAVLLLAASAVFHKREDARCFGRRIAGETVQYASVVALMYLLLFWAGGFAISTIEGLPMLECFFETASAIGTVGLSLGITPGLGTASRLILIALMFFGRVGGLTLIFAVVSGTREHVSKMPLEKITVG